jgi:hypothetical protein
LEDTLISKFRLNNKIKMGNIVLIHWNRMEAEQRIAQLKTSGIDAVFEKFNGPGTLRAWREDRPTAIIIDLSRIPSQGRDIALAIRHYKTTRFVPLILVDGHPEKLKRIQELLPDATYTSWDQIDIDLRQTIDHPPNNPVVPRSVLEGYAGTPLVKKLGIKANSHLILLNAPIKFEKNLENLPENVSIKYTLEDRVECIIWFTIYKKDLKDNIDRIAQALNKKGSLWIAWPKKASGVTSDLTQNVVRQIGLAKGLVDYKICAIDNVWSALKFSRRKSG